MIDKIISGGQTGVDRAALDAAMELGVATGGWCPQGRRAEDGIIDEKYPLQETTQQAYQVRTRWNVRDSDGTLIVSPLPLTGGTALTLNCAKQMGRPCLIVDSHQHDDKFKVKEWITSYRIHVLNIAGPRESHYPGIYQQTRQWLLRLGSEILTIN